MISNFIHGRKVAAADEATTDLIDPSTGEVYATAPLADGDLDAITRLLRGLRDGAG